MMRSKQEEHEMSNEDLNGNGVAKDKSPLEKELENLTNLLASLTSPYHRSNGMIMSEMEMQLLEKKSLCLLKLKKYDQVVEECYRIIGKRGPNSIVYKCLIVALCRTGKYDEVRDTLNQWGKLCPKDPLVKESKDIVERFLSIVRSGMNATEVFQNLDQVLGLFAESNWKHRAPPKIPSFFMCTRAGQEPCVLGDNCTGAHSSNELAEWKVRHELRNRSWEKPPRTNGPKLSSSAQYLFDITKKIQETTNIRSLLADELPNVRWKCHEPLKITTTQRGLDMKWSMLVGSKTPVRTVALLHDKNRPNFWISAAYYHSVKCNTDINLFVIHEVNRTPRLQVANTFVPSQIFLQQLGGWPDWFYYKLELSFNSHVCGSFRQTVMFDLKSDPKLVKHLSVELIPDTPEPPPFNLDTFSEDLRLTQRNPPAINLANLEVVDSESGVRVDLAFHRAPVMSNIIEKPVIRELTRDNYVADMAQFIELEQKARQDELSKYNITGNLELTSSYTIERNYESLLKCAWQGQLYAKLSLGQEISEDTSLGRLITHSCQNVLLVEVTSAACMGTKPRGYMCKIAEKMKSTIMISVGANAVQELNLAAGTSRNFIVHFRLDDRNFMEMRRVLQSVGDTQLDILFPDLITLDVDLSRIVGNATGLFFEGDFTLNERQLQAYNTVTSLEERAMPPLLLIGPFGTGKTYTLAQCLKKILATSVSPDSPRILICTHSNSAADLYILNFLHQWYEEGMKSARPLRIYYADRMVQTVPQVVKKYCLLANDGMSFRYPTRDEVLGHQVIIVTLSTAAELLALGLERDTFTHILLDEAAQALETEAIQPLVLAGPLTKIVLAGDHMQLSPELFSTFTQGRAVSLLERLNNIYPKENKCRIILTENYRSHEAILKFASDAFYEGQLRCASVQPCHPNFYPITFFAVRGDDVLPDSGASFYNMQEVLKVTECISELVKTWPEQWGNYKADGAIAVLTPYAGQVTRIRHHLRTRNLGFVSVERVLNVQGKQFRAVIVSTVRTHRVDIPWTEATDLGFLSNPKLLNTALTRAQSLFAIVGDPLSLCAAGKCRTLWSDLVAISTANNSFFGLDPAEVKQQLVNMEMKHIFANATPFRSNMESPVSLHGKASPSPLAQLYTRSTTPADATVPQPDLVGQSLHEAMPNLQSTMAQLELSQELSPESLTPSALDDSADDKELALLDKLLSPQEWFPQVASIWSNNDSGSPSGAATPSKSSSNIWAPIDHEGDTSTSSTAATPNFSSYSSPLLRENVNPNADGLKDFVIAPSNTSPELFRDNLTPTGKESPFPPLTELKLNAPTPLVNYLPKESRLSQILSLNSASSGHRKNELPFPNFGPSAQLVGRPAAEPPINFYGNQNPAAMHHGVMRNHTFSPENHYRPNNLNHHRPVSPFGVPYLPPSSPGYLPPSIRAMMNNNNNSSPRPLITPRPLPLFSTPFGYNQPAYPAQAFIRNASPVASLSSSEASDPINVNDFPTLAETTAPAAAVTKGKGGKKEGQGQGQGKANQKQKVTKGTRNGVENGSGNSSNNNHNTSNGNNSNNNNNSNSNNNNGDEWVQVRKKKTKVKDSTPIPSGEEKIELLISMGFEKKKAIRALQNTNRNLDEAIEWLLRKSSSQNGESH